jgi:hypothetical protein
VVAVGPALPVGETHPQAGWLALAAPRLSSVEVLVLALEPVQEVQQYLPVLVLLSVLVPDQLP